MIYSIIMVLSTSKQGDFMDGKVDLCSIMVENGFFYRKKIALFMEYGAMVILLTKRRVRLKR